MWIGDAAAEHLVAAADAQDKSAAPQMGPQVDVPAEFPQRREIGDGRLRSRQDDQRGVARHRLMRPEKDQIDAGFQSKRIEIVEVGDARIDQHGDAQPAVGAGDSTVLQDHRVFRRQSMRVGEERHQAQRLPACAVGDERHAVVEQRRIAAEAIDDEADDHCGVGRIDHGLGADQARDHAAAVDVA